MTVTNPDVNQRLMDAAYSGERVTVRFTAGKRNRPGYSITGTVDGFVKRPGAAEKVRMVEPGCGAAIRTEIAVGRVYEVIARPFATAYGAPAISATGIPYTIALHTEWPNPAPTDLITDGGEA